MSDKVLSPQQFLYHHAPTQARHDIQHYGLAPHKPSNPEGDDLPEGVYLQQEHTAPPDHDLYRVNTAGLELRSDPDTGMFHDLLHKSPTYYTPTAIGPKQLKRVVNPRKL